MKVLGFLVLFAVTAVTRTAAGKAPVTPIANVISLLEDLQTKVQQEGKDEAAQYDKFACFCKDSTDQKTAAIDDNEHKVENLQASIASHETDATALGEEIIQKNLQIAAKQEELDADAAQRAKEVADFEANNEDMKQAIDALERAISTLESARNAATAPGSSLVQLRKDMKIVKKALLLASVQVSAAQRKAVNALAQPDSGDYSFHSGDILNTLEGLLTTWRNNKADADAEEANLAAAFMERQAAGKLSVGAMEREVGTMKTEKADHEAKAAAAKQELEDTQITLADDQEYLKALTENCESKAKTWDQRTKTRANELAVLAEALGILKGDGTAAAENAGLAEKAEGGEADSSSLMQDGDSEDVSQEEADIDGTSDFDSPLSFLQISAEQFHREKALEVVKKAARKLKSTELMAMAMHVASDPFVKVRQLIQELIERLLQQARDEATAKGWCDTELGKAKNKRDFKMADIEELNAEIMQLSAKKDMLDQEMSDLTGDIADLQDKLNTTTTDRAADKSTNLQVIRDAQAGAAAIKKAIAILTKFYQGAAFMQIKQNPQEHIMDEQAGFEGNYKGAQSEGKNIVGMLEVILADFERQAAQTEAAEKEAHKQFYNFETISKASIAEKETQHANDEQELEKTEAALETAFNDLQETQTALDEALKYLDELKPQCEDAGMTYQERKERMQKEIDALKEALRLLNAYSPSEPSVLVQTKSLRRRM